MSISFPLVSPSTAPTLASISTNGFFGLLGDIAMANSLPARPASQLSSSQTVANAYSDAITLTTAYVTGQPIDQADTDARLESIQATFAALSLAVSQVRTVIAANPGTLSVSVGGTVTSVGAGAQLLRLF